MATRKRPRSVSSLVEYDESSEDSDGDVPQVSEIKRSRVQWQETLLSLVAAQQEQLSQLTRQQNIARMATTPRANQSTDSAYPSATSTASFRLAEFNPDTANYPIEEWFEVATKLKEELSVGDTLMIARAGEALKGRAHQYYIDWGPVRRTWEDFCTDLIIAFPDRETPGARAYTAATLRSRDYTSLSDYGIQKLRAISRFYSDLPWNTVLSMVEYGLDHNEAQAAIRIQQPSANRELLKILTDFDARLRKHQHRVDSTTRSNNNTRTSKRRPNTSTFMGTCFRCGRNGHRQTDCPTPSRTSEAPKSPNTHEIIKRRESNPPTCNHCKRPGHTDVTCWQKHGKPKNIMLLRQRRDFSLMPLATLLYDNKFGEFTYLIDSGADISILCESAANKLGVPIEPNVRLLSGLGSSIVYSIGTCEVVVSLSTITLEVTFTVVPDDVMPGNLSAIIGWDVIGRSNLRVDKSANGIELHHDLLNIPKILTVTSANSLEQIKVSGLDEQSTTQLRQLLVECHERTPDHILTGKLRITLKDDMPVAYRPRRLAYAERTQLKQIIQNLLQEGIIRESCSAYASPVVLVKKKNGDLRLCIDYRDLNRKSVKERYPLPHIHDQIDALSGAKYFTTLDMKAGFHQVEIEESSKHFTAFITPDGLYEYNRMPFGYVNSPAVYQRAIDKALGGLKGTQAHVYMDDVLVPSTMIEEGLSNLKNVLNALSDAGFRLNYNKCTFFATEIEYLGVIVSEGSVRPSPRKVSALTKTPVPTDVKSVRQFLGLASYFRRFIQRFSIIVAPISALLRKDQVFEWSTECESARQLVIDTLTKQPVLGIFNPKLECELHTDASAIGIGAVLFQKENNIVRPVAYYSRRTTECEAKYHAYDLETLAIVDAAEHFRVYLYGRSFTIYTDCNAIRATALKKNLHPRVARWWIKLQDYDFTIEYRPGHKMGHVDYLSRNPVDILCVAKTVNRPDAKGCKTLEDFQRIDVFCKDVFKNPSDHKDYTVQNGLVLTVGNSPKCYVPVAARLLIMHRYHDKSSHIGWEKCIAKMQEDLFWPKMGKCLKKYIQNCRACVLGKSHTGRRAGLWQQGEKPKNILDTWHVDHAGPLVKSQGCTQILVIIDAFSKYCSLKPIKKKSSEDSIKALFSVFNQLGKPRRIIADRGTAFTSTMFQNFLSDQRVELHHIATGVPRGNGMVERLMRTVFNLLRATLTDQKESTWITALAEIETVLNTTVHGTTGFAPAVLQFGTNPRLPATADILPDIVANNNYIDPNKAVADAQARISCIENKQADRFNVTRYAAKLFSVGDQVVIENSQLTGGGKLKSKYSGPFTVRTILPNERYLLWKKGKRTTVAAHEQLRNWPEVQNS